ncbi:hypothetical protein NC653_038797 [Populus alba x Populus x berolinensis]|uniref:Uncharacterized protein n=1 Tax=Populus alba x Populus x berolinensis TaxID=444605 RepID=A0AAD6LHW1_9ROSI|nr:hypothetical protein NC653_038797 [Populus alba x Populus x berolinensis]
MGCQHPALLVVFIMTHGDDSGSNANPENCTNTGGDCANLEKRG